MELVVCAQAHTHLLVRYLIHTLSLTHSCTHTRLRTFSCTHTHTHARGQKGAETCGTSADGGRVRPMQRLVKGATTGCGWRPLKTRYQWSRVSPESLRGGHSGGCVRVVGGGGGGRVEAHLLPDWYPLSFFPSLTFPRYLSFPPSHLIHPGWHLDHTLVGGAGQGTGGGGDTAQVPTAALPWKILDRTRLYLAGRCRSGGGRRDCRGVAATGTFPRLRRWL